MDIGAITTRVCSNLKYILLLTVLTGLTACSQNAGQISGAASKPAEAAEPAATPTPPATPTGEATPVDDRALSVLLVTHPTSDVIKKHLGEFEALTGYPVRVEIATFDETHYKQLLDLGAGTSQYDVMMVIDTWLPEFTSSGNVLDLRAQFRKLEAEGDFRWKSDLIENANVLLGQWQGKQVSVPIMASTQLLMYRKDLFAEQQEAFRKYAGRELTVPQTWEEYNEVARFFTRKFNPDSPTDYGVSVAAEEGNSALCLFQPILWGVGGREFAKRWRVTINNQYGLKAMKLWAEQAQYAPPEAPDMYWDDMNRAFRDGRAAMQIQWDSFIPQLEQDADSQVRGKVGYALVPGQPESAPVIGGWVLVINKNSKRIPLAWDFIRWSAGPEFGLTLNREGGQLPRTSLYTDKELAAQYPHYAVALQSLEQAQQRTSYVRRGPALSAQSQYEAIVGGAAHAAFTGEKSPQQAVDDAADGLSAMLDQIARP